MLNHISFIDHFKTKKTKNANKCQRYTCFCVFECAGTDMKEMDKTEQNRQHKHEIWNECHKPRPGKHFSHLSSKVSSIVLKESQNA